MTTDSHSHRLRASWTFRRGLLALLVSGVTVLLAGGLLGLATAQESAPMISPVVPGSFGVAWPHLGDRGAYALSVVERTEDGVVVIEPDRPYLEFAWVADAPLRDSNGTLRRAYELEFAYGGRTETQHHLFDAQSNHLLAHRGGGSVSIGGRPQSFLEETTGSRSNETRTEWAGSVYFSQHHRNEDNVPCGLRNALQGEVVNLSAPIALDRPCTHGDVWSHPECLRFQAIGMETVGDLQTIVFETVNHRGRYGGTDCTPPEAPWTPTREYAWYAADLPYPVRLAVESWDNPNRYGVLTLQAFARGEKPLSAPGDLPFVGPLPELRWSDRKPWGPDDSDVQHPFKLSQAYAIARDDPNSSRMRDFLVAHPNSFTASATYGEVSQDNGTRVDRTWGFVLVDGGASLHPVVMQRTRPLQDAAGETWLPGLTPSDRTEYEIRYGSAAYPGMSDVDPPARVPTVGSAMARWAGWADASLAGYGPNAWAYRVEENNHELQMVLSVGTVSVRSTTSGIPGVYLENETRAFRLSLVSLDESGQVIQVFEGNSEWSRRGQASAPTPATAADGPVAFQGLDATTHALWHMPAGQYAAGAGLVAAVVGLFYWAWPTLKQLAFAPLYSRLETPKALHHPVRAELMALVEANPGIHLQEILRRTGRAMGMVQHHLGKLVEVGLVTAAGGPGYVCYFRRGRVDRAVMDAAPLLKSDGARRVLAAIADHPGISGVQVADLARLTRQAVHFHVERLASAGLVATCREGSVVRLTAASHARGALRIASAS